MPTYRYWNPSDKNEDISLSVSDTIADCTTTSRRGVRSIDSNNDGKWYMEFNLAKINGTASGIDCQVGLALSTVDLSDNVSADSSGAAYYVGGIDEDEFTTGKAYFFAGTDTDKSMLNLGGAWTDGVIMSLAVDFSTGNIWFGINGTWRGSGDPETGYNPTWTSSDLTLGDDFYCICSVIGGADPTQVELLSDPADHIYSTPSGYNSGWFAPNVHTGTISAALGMAETLALVREVFGTITEGAGVANGDIGLRDRSLIAGNAGLNVALELDSPYRELTIIAGMGDLTLGMNTTSPITASADLSEIVAVLKEHFSTISLNVGLGESIIGVREFPVSISAGAGMGELIAGFNYSSFLSDNEGQISFSYECTLTGSADGVSDLTLPISSLQSVIRTGEPTYLSVVIPTYDYFDAITARSNGSIVVEIILNVGGVEQVRELLSRVDLESIRSNKGGRRQSITLSGHKTKTWTGKVTTLQNPSQSSVAADGRLTYQADVDIYLRPGDTVNAGSDTFTAGNVSLSISKENQIMKVTEAA